MSIDVYWLLLPESTINLTMHTQFVLWAPLVYACTMCMCVYSLVRSLSHSFHPFVRSFVRACVCMYVRAWYACVCVYVSQSKGILYIGKTELVSVYANFNSFVSFDKMRWNFYFLLLVFAGYSCFKKKLTKLSRFFFQHDQISFTRWHCLN